MKHWFFSALAAFALSGSAATAAPLSVFELSDFADTRQSAVSVGVAEVGTNFVNGGIDASVPDNGDFFAFDILPGSQLTSISFGSEATDVAFLLQFYSQNPTVPTAQDFIFSARVNPNTFTTFNQTTTMSSFPQGPNTYFLGVSFFNDSRLDANDSAFWTFQLGVEPAAVPLPAGLPLLLAGLGGFAALRRTRMRSR